MSASSSRHRQALQTRQRIRDAARELFLARGYAATTIADVARTAGVAPQTVYFTYGSKAAVLSAVIDAEIVGDVEPVPLLDRPAAKRVAAAAAPADRLRRAVKLVCEVTERVAPLYEIARAGAIDPEVRALLNRHEQERWQTHNALTGLIVGDLRSGLDLKEATDRLYALVSHDVYWLLVKRRGWTANQWQRFAQEEARHQLLPA